jgi:hypothetical protein
MPGRPGFQPVSATDWGPTVPEGLIDLVASPLGELEPEAVVWNRRCRTPFGVRAIAYDGVDPARVSMRLKVDPG